MDKAGAYQGGRRKGVVCWGTVIVKHSLDYVPEWLGLWLSLHSSCCRSASHHERRASKESHQKPVVLIWRNQQASRHGRQCIIWSAYPCVLRLCVCVCVCSCIREAADWQTLKSVAVNLAGSRHSTAIDSLKLGLFCPRACKKGHFIRRISK